MSLALRDGRMEVAHNVPHLDPFLLRKKGNVSALSPLFQSRTRIIRRQLQSRRVPWVHQGEYAD